MNTSLETAIFELDTYGFTILENIIDKIYLTQLKTEFDLLFNENMNFELLNIVTKSPVFFNLIDLPPIIEIIETFLSPNIILAFLNGRVILPSEKAQVLHSDIPYQIVTVEKPQALNVIFLIDDFTPNNGATVILPLSHRIPIPVPANKPIKYTHKIIAQEGSIVIFNANCWHGSSENTSNIPRRSIFAQYRVSFWTRFQFNPHNNFNQYWYKLLNEKQKKLMRMEKGIGVDNSSDIE